MTDITEVMRGATSVRHYSSRYVGDALLFRVLDNARFAPSGGNRQGWRVVVVRAESTKSRLVDLYAQPWQEYAERRYRAETYAGQRRRSGDAFAASFGSAPVILVFWALLAAIEVTDGDLARPSIVAGGSIFPFIHNVHLGLCAEGLGSRITTLLSRREQEVAELLRVPAGLALAAAMTVGYPEHRTAPLPRRPVEEFAFLESFAGAPLTNRQ